MSAGRPHGRNDPSLMSSLESALTQARRPGPFELGWRWRWELALLAGLASLAAFIAINAGLIGLSVAAGAGLAAGTALLCLPPTRRWLIAMAWCLITPHRVLAGCMNAWVQTRSGKLPIILATMPAAYGERVRIWLRAGTTAADLYAARDMLAVACWAAEVHVVPSPRHAHLVTLQVIRTSHPERIQPTAQGWPYSRRVAGDGLSDTDERDTGRGGWTDLPSPRPSPQEGWPEWNGRSHAPVPMTGSAFLPQR
jgi:hypothetical protein